MRNGALAIALAAGLASGAAWAAGDDGQVIEPQVARREIAQPHIPSSDFELGTFIGSYNVQNFGAHLVYGVRAGYAITEDWFAEAVFGSTRASDGLFREILPGGIFPTPSQRLWYYNASLGYNLLPGEIYLGSKHTYLSSLYVVGGLGSTKLYDERQMTVNAGFGGRMFLANWVAVQMDLRDHMFPLDLLGARRHTQNLEWTGGVTFFF